MTAAQEWVANLVVLLLVGTLAGLLLTGRLWLCRSFGVYIAATIVTNRLVVWWPDRFYAAEFWSVKELILRGLVLAVAFELAGVALQSFPRAQRLARWGIGIVAALTAFAISGVIAGGAYAWVMVFARRAALGAAWAMLVVVVVAGWYRIPLLPWHRTIMVGFILYQSLYAVQQIALVGTVWSADSYILALDPVSYAATVGVWMFGACRPMWAAAVRVVAER
jgi:hypothetical protein